jgi:hypothetical protein
LYELAKIEKEYKTNGPSVLLYEKAIRLKLKQPFPSLWETDISKYKNTKRKNNE